MGLLFGGALKSLGKGLETFGGLKLKQEAEQAQFLRDQNMARFRANLTEEKTIAAEGRAFERTGSGVFDEAGRELTKQESKDYAGKTYSKAETAKKGLLAEAETKREIKKEDAILEWVDAGLSRPEAEIAYGLEKKFSKAGVKELSGDVRVKLLKDAREQTMLETDPSDPMFDKKLEENYQKGLKLIKGGKKDIASEATKTFSNIETFKAAIERDPQAVRQKYVDAGNTAMVKKIDAYMESEGIIPKAGRRYKAEDNLQRIPPKGYTGRPSLLGSPTEAVGPGEAAQKQFLETTGLAPIGRGIYKLFTSREGQ